MKERIRVRFRLIKPILPLVMVYVGLLVFSLHWIKTNPESPWKILVALAPMIPGLLIALGTVRAILKLDELEQKILLQGIAVSFICTLILVMSLGLAGIAGAPQLNGTWIGLIMVVLWLAGKLWANWRYR